MADTQKLHPATLVTNIKTCIPIVLDYDGTQYNTWYTLFELHCRTNLVLDHINPPVVDDKDSEVSENAQTAQWQRLDDIVRQWIYNTISTDLLNSIIDPDEKVIDAWNRLKEFFPNNKSTRALHLDAQFTNTKLDQFDGVKPYCTRLKTLAYSLRNVGDKVSDNRMALQLLKGLSEEYKPFRTSVRHLNPLPSFDTLRSMLELEEQGNAADIAVDSHEEAHVSQSPSMIPKSGGEQTQSSGNSRGSTPRNGGRKNNKGKGSGHGKGKSAAAGHGGRNAQPQQQQHHNGSNSSQQQQGQGWMFPPQTPYWGYWTNPPWQTPPCPYPSQGPGPIPWSPRPNQPYTQGVLGPRPQQAYAMTGPPSSSSGCTPTNIDQAMHTMSLTDPSYYMDIGATSHMSNSQDGEQNSEM
ncbi:uncharacterized protein LOC110699804 isoform X2 [Chenopodium quinoa]|uniref:uncharacterized protein LOC110699804 isoform X2 n=1 Tax=Chenopodium quinoa TaxID=63459 RepID=UPI000B76FDC9|nr:uncharacterized protein LOC110699804 isoform X2 [Chenopodium quinoa]